MTNNHSNCDLDATFLKKIICHYDFVPLEQITIKFCGCQLLHLVIYEMFKIGLNLILIAFVEILVLKLSLKFVLSFLGEHKSLNIVLSFLFLFLHLESPACSILLVETLSKNMFFSRYIIIYPFRVCNR